MLVGGAARTGAIDCRLSVTTGIKTLLIRCRTERALGLQGHEFMVVSNENTVSKEQRFLGTSWVSL